MSVDPGEKEMNVKFQNILHTLSVSGPEEVAEIRRAIEARFNAPPGMTDGGVREPKVPMQPLLSRQHKK